MLRSNHHVIITSEAGQVFGRIEEVRGINEVPAAGGLTPAELFKALESAGVTRVATISYHTSPSAQFLITAVEIEGQWYDLEKRALDIEIIGYHGAKAV